MERSYRRALSPRPRTGCPVKDVPRPIPVGKAELLQHSDHDRVAIFALGALVPMAEEIARKLEAFRDGSRLDLAHSHPCRSVSGFCPCQTEVLKFHFFGEAA